MARLFNGSSDVVTAPDSAVLRPASITISLWFNSSSASLTNGNFDGFLERQSGSGGASDWYIGAGGTANKLAYFFSNGTSSIVAGSATISASTWYHNLITYDGSNLAAYVNSASDGTASGGSAFSYTVGKPVLIGTGNLLPTGPTGQYFNGSLADVAIWNTILTGTQISNLAAGRRANNIGANANLAGYWPLVCQSPEPDFSGNGNNGTVTGTICVADPPQLDPLVLGAAVGILGLAQAEW